jgi:hypothetical protein
MGGQVQRASLRIDATEREEHFWLCVIFFSATRPYVNDFCVQFQFCTAASIF